MIGTREGEGKTAPPGPTRQKSSGKCVKSGLRRAGARGFAPASAAKEQVQDEREDGAHDDAGDEREIEGERAAPDEDVSGDARHEHEHDAEQDGGHADQDQDPPEIVHNAGAWPTTGTAKSTGRRYAHRATSRRSSSPRAPS